MEAACKQASQYKCDVHAPDAPDRAAAVLSTAFAAAVVPALACASPFASPPTTADAAATNPGSPAHSQDHAPEPSLAAQQLQYICMALSQSGMPQSAVKGRPWT